MFVSLPVIAHGAALGDGFGVGKGNDAVFRGREQQFHRIDGLANIAPASGGNVIEHPFFGHERRISPRVHDIHRALRRLFYILRRNGLEFKHRGAAEDRVENSEIGVFSGGGNQRDAPVLNKLQEGLLLFLIKILDLVQIQKDAAGGEKGVQLIDDLLDIGDASRGGVELSERAVRALGDDAGDRSLARTRGAVEDHIRDLAAVHDAAQKPALAEDMALPDHIVERVGADFVRKRLIHESSPFVTDIMD